MEGGVWIVGIFLIFFFFPSPLHSAWLLMAFYCTCLYKGKDTPDRNLEWHLQNNHLYSAHISHQQYYTDSSSKGKKQDS